MKADWAHVFLSVLPQLPLETVKDETRIALALKSSCASLMTKYAPNAPLRTGKHPHMSLLSSLLSSTRKESSRFMSQLHGIQSCHRLLMLGQQ